MNPRKRRRSIGSYLPGPIKRAIKLRRVRLFERLGSTRYSRPALYDMEAKIQKYLDFDGGIFIECGANDGYEQSNTYYLEKFRNWTGLLIEAIPDLFRSCKSVRPNAIAVNCALGEIDNGVLTIRSENLVSTIMQTDKRDATGKYIQIASRTLSSVLAEFGFTKVDFFSLDVEGFELSVLKGLNSDRHQIRFILVETANPEAVAGVLGDRYKLVDQFSHHDYLFERTDFGGVPGGVN